MESHIAKHFPARIETRPGRGRCLVAARDLHPGETVLVSAPAAVLPFLGLGCAFCSSRPAGGKLSRCGACKGVGYCGKACQAGDWKDHKVECKAWRNLATLPDVSGAVSHGILASRVLRGHRLRPAGDDATAVSQSPVYAHSLADVQAMEVDDSPMRAPADRIAVEIARTNGLLDASVSDDDARRMVSAFDRNNFSVTDDIMMGKAAGVYPAGAILNHSCAPNCCLSYSDYWLPDGATAEEHEAAAEAAPKGRMLQVIRTLTSVPAGAELVHSYVEIARPRAERQSHLWRTYGFKCGCELCSSSNSSSDGAKSSDSNSGDEVEGSSDRFLERRIDGGRLPAFVSEGYSGGDPAAAAAASDIPSDMDLEAVQALKSARVLLRAVEAGPAPPPETKDDGRAAGGVHLNDQLIGRVAASNLAVFPASDGGGDKATAVTSATHIIGRQTGANSNRSGAIRRYVPTRGAVSQLPPEDEASVKLELTAVEASLLLLERAGAHSLHLDVHSGAVLAWSRYMLLQDTPLALVAGEHMHAFYSAVYARCANHPMAGLHTYALADQYAELMETVMGYLEALKRRGQPNVPNARAGMLFMTSEHAGELRRMYRSPEAHEAIELLSQPVSATMAAALKVRTAAHYERTAAIMGIWLGRGHKLADYAVKRAAAAKAVKLEY